MIINLNESKDRWDDFVSTSPHRSIFVKTRFLDSLGCPYRLVTLNEQDRIVAGTPIILDSDLQAISDICPYTMYQGILLGPIDRSLRRASRKDTNFVLRLGEEVAHTFGEVTLVQNWRLADLRGLQWINYCEPDRGQYRLDVAYTGVLDLTPFDSFEQFLRHIRASRRYEYRKGIARLDIVDSVEVDTLDLLHRRTITRSGGDRSHQEDRLLRSVAKAALEGGYGTLRVASLDGQPVGAVFFLHDDRSSYYLFGATDPEHRNSAANTTLLLELIRKALTEGQAEVDFVGVNSPQRGDYKISFGPQVRPYFTASFRLPVS